MAVDIFDVEYSDWVNRKVNAKKSCTLDDVFDVIEKHFKAAWDDDEDRGLRLLVDGYSETGRKLRVILYPIEGQHGSFRLGTVIEGQ